MTQPLISYKRHRFPPQIIAHAAWLYFLTAMAEWKSVTLTAA
jgi:hypothetical protein